MNRYDVIVIGGGLLGCFAARNLTRYRLKTALLEAREDVSTGISRANTAIVYSGCDTKPGTLKTSMCVRAAQGFEELCKQLGVRYKKCGSIMICFGPKGAETLRRKYKQGVENGVRGLRLISREEVLALEPHVSSDVYLGLFAPDSGTVNPWELCLAAAENAVQNGAELFLNTKVTRIEQAENGYVVSSGEAEFFTRGLINCAGLYADEVMEMLNKPEVRIFPTAGDYCILDTKVQGRHRNGFISHVIFHEPEEKGKGLTMVPTIDGNILVGPTEVPVHGKSGFQTTRYGLDLLNRLIEEVIPSLPLEHMIRTFGALRPNPYGVYLNPETGAYETENRSISNFTIIENEPAFLSFVGIKTPGLTCANELGLYAADKMAGLLGPIQQNTSYDPVRPAPVRLNELSYKERAAMIRKNPAYGKIICRCRQISEGEILDSLRNTTGAGSADRVKRQQGDKPVRIGAATVDGVKRRTGIGTGRCQGSFCIQRVLEIIAKERGCAPSDVMKDGPGSYLIGGDCP
jgi:glycerol-3-phosphate dehydrogenase